MQNVTTVSLSDDELAMVLARRGNATAVVEAPIPPTQTGFMAKMHALAGTSLNRRLGVRPVAVVNTERGKRGVFWVGYKEGTLRVGYCKMTDTGRCHKPNRFDGSWFCDAANLADLNQ